LLGATRFGDFAAQNIQLMPKDKDSALQYHP